MRDTGDHIGRWRWAAPDDPLAAYAGDPGAQVFRACVACHTLTPDEGNRAGPTLAGIFGRRIATLPGYNFSPALKKLDIVWTPETVAKLFEIGPMTYTPGTKMPEQPIGSPEDRAALVKFLEKATKKESRTNSSLARAPSPRARADNPRWCAPAGAACRRGRSPPRP